MISKSEYNTYFEQYMQLVNLKETIIFNLQDSQECFHQILENLPKEKHSFFYADGKWTIKQLIQHIIDTERVFCYRALCFARKGKASLPGFDQDIFVANDNANDRNYKDLIEEMQVLRKGTIQLFKSFSEEALLRVGVASENKMSVRALGYLFSGHQLHHLNIIKERYL